MKEINLEKFNNTEYIEYLKQNFNSIDESTISNVDNYINFLASLKPHIKDFKTISKKLFNKFGDTCFLASAEDFFNYLLELIKSGHISIDEVIYLINSSYLSSGFKIYLEKFIANKSPLRFPHTMRKFSELDPDIEKLIIKYNLQKEKSI